MMTLETTPWDALHSDIIAALVDEVVPASPQDALERTIRALAALLEQALSDTVCVYGDVTCLHSLRARFE